MAKRILLMTGREARRFVQEFRRAGRGDVTWTVARRRVGSSDSLSTAKELGANMMGSTSLEVGPGMKVKEESISKVAPSRLAFEGGLR